MPGFSFHSSSTGGGDLDNRIPYVLANNLSGGNQNAIPGALYKGDIVALTTFGALATNAQGVNVPVVRPLLQADITYGITVSNVGGILGVCTEDLTTNSNGQISGVPSYGMNPASNVIFALPSPSARWALDVYSARNRLPIILAMESNYLKARISPAYTAAPQGSNLNGTMAGIQAITGVGAPAAPSVAASGTGSTIPVGTYYVVTTYLGVVGETLASPPTLVTTTSGQNIVVTGLATLTGQATTYNVYVGTSASGPFYRQGAATATGTNNTLTALTLSGTTTPLTNTTGAPGVTQYYINPSATPLCLSLILVDGTDRNYGVQFAAGNTTAGALCQVQVLSTFCQMESTNVLPYTAQ